MIDHILNFPDEAAAQAALPSYGTRDEKGTWVWDTSRVITGMSVVSQEAVWDTKDPKNPILTTPEQKLSGFWIMIATPTEKADLKALNALSQTRDRTAKTVANDKGAVGAKRLAPVFAGSAYDFG